jgi:hypothetical protein
MVDPLAWRERRRDDDVERAAPGWLDLFDETTGEILLAPFDLPVRTP